ncbi:RidA family protein [Parvularcula marina]|uniref:RidA family protein n=1 Tax=Parvularcula marina TaxID=2292771 RepID=A0A371RJQ9_9PROT|nr:RidA family protein [Parvularcula marina]RFB05683.1 RidA family protein [Parvularcula marina]
MKTTLALLFGLSLIGTAVAQEKQAIVPEGMETTVEYYSYSPAVRAGDMVYLAGVVAGLPTDPETGEMIEATPENLDAAFDRAFIHIGEILTAAGADWDDVVDMTTYHTDMPIQIDTFLQVKNRYMKPPHTAWTAIDIDRLYPDTGITEIKITAYAPLGRE